MSLEAQVLMHDPFDQCIIEALGPPRERRPMKRPIVGIPAADLGTEHPRQIVHPLVDPALQVPVETDLLPDLLECRGTHGGSKAQKELPLSVLGSSRTEQIPQKLKVLLWVPLGSIGVPAVNHSGFLGMQGRVAP